MSVAKMISRQIFKSFPSVRLKLVCKPYSSSNEINKRENELEEKLKQRIPGTTFVKVQDISHGLGAMYEVNIEAKEFADLSLVNQHRVVFGALKDEIRSMRAIRVNTMKPVPPGVIPNRRLF